VKRKCVRCK